MRDASALARSAASASSCAASVTAVGRPRATSAAKLGPDRIAGVAFGAHSAITSVMNLWVPCSMPLAQAMTGVRGAIDAASALTTERIACAGTTSRIASARAASREIAGHRDAVLDPHAAQELALALLRELLGVRRVVLPQRDRCARRAP